MKTQLKISIFILSTVAFTGCATTTEQGATGVNRSQFTWGVSSEEIDQEAAKSYEATKKEAQAKHALDVNRDELRRVTEISKRLIPQTAIFRKDALQWKWEVHVISSKELNAYCMPGGKIIFYSGLIEQLKMTDGEIAAVMGHEISHALREHGRERMAEELAKQKGLGLLSASGAVQAPYVNAIGLASNYIFTLPHSRTQESEADTMGVELMARAGYNPQEAMNLWKKMGAVGGDKPPELLSTHPADETRLKHIASLMPKVMPLYEQASKK